MSSNSYAQNMQNMQYAQSQGCTKGKVTCTRLKSCKRAAFEYEHCGHLKLDRDRDGIPCESLCGKTLSEYRRLKK